MTSLARSFKKDGWPVINWSYPSRQKNIEDHADDLVQRLRMISQEEPGKAISFVAHSMGGLIVRCALNHPYCPEEAKWGSAVLIAPPNRGSVLARRLYKYKIVRWVLGQMSGKQLMTTPLDGFDRLGNFPQQMPVMVISGTAGFNPMIPGKSDGKVGVEESCLTTPHIHETIWAGHCWICHCPDTIKRAKSFMLSTAPISTPPK